MNKFGFIFSLFLLFPVIISAQIFPQEGYDVGSLVPENYILKDVTLGDLNGDGQDDLVIIIRNKETKIKSAAIYYSELDQWKLILESEQFFLLKDTTDAYDPSLQNSFNKLVYEEYVTMSIRNEVISIGTSDGYGNSIDAKFRSNQKGAFELIGIDFSTYSRNVSQNTSINYLTNKMEFTEELIGQGLNGKSENWFKVSNLAKVNFDEFSVKKIYFDIDQVEFERIP